MKKQYLISLVCLIVFCLLMFFITYFSPSSVLSTEGYFVSGEDVEKVLLSEKKVTSAKNIKLKKVNYEDNFYNNLNNLYVGDKKKTKVNDNYPVFSNKGSAVVNLSDKNKIINNEFEYYDSYLNFTITDGKLYNYGDLEQADQEDYIFMQLKNNTFMNLYEMKVKTFTKEYKVPVNSIIDFKEDYMRYFYYNDDVLVYDIIEGIDFTNEIVMGKTKFTYKDLLLNFNKIEEEIEESPEPTETPEEEVKPDEDGVPEIPVIPYVKPRVKVENFVANVYSATSKLYISDPSGAIRGGVSFQFKIGDKPFLRKTFVSGGPLKIIGLVPNTKFKIVGSFKYYNEEGKKIENTFFEQEITTLGIENLEPIELSFKNGQIYSNKIELTNLQIVSRLDSEAINGINKAYVVIDGEEYSISRGFINAMRVGREVTYTSPAKLKSNSVYKYEIRFYDGFKNSIKLINNKGTTRTSKKEPTASLIQQGSDVTTTIFSIELKNPDDVNISNYRYVVFDNNMAVVQSGELKDLEDQTVALKGLDPNATYVIRAMGDYDIEDGLGIKKDQILGESKFTTKPLSSLGYLRIRSEVDEMTSHSAKLKSFIDVESVSTALLDLINDVTLTITTEDGEVVYQKSYKSSALNKIKDGSIFYDFVDNLKSATEYFVEFTSTGKQGSIEEDIPVTCGLKKFKVYKEDATVLLRNKFVTGDMIDFDVSISDKDGAIITDRVILEVRDGNDKLIATEYININDDYVQLTYDKLNEKTNYLFTYKVEEYNVGYDNRTYKSDYTIFEEIIFTEPGIKGKIELRSLLRQIESPNLFNISDYDRIRKEGNTGYKKYEIENNVMILGGKNGWVNFSYFVPEARDKKIVVKFRARYHPGTTNKAKIYLANNFSSNYTYHLKDINDEYSDYLFSFQLKSNYIGFLIDETSGKNLTTYIDIKDLEIKILDNFTEKVKLEHSYHESGYKFTDTKLISGNDEMPNPKGSGTITGNEGNGYAKITNLTNGSVKEFKFIGKGEEFVVPSNGVYKFEVWGAQGGCTSRYPGGKGAYASGKISLKSGEKFYVYVGGTGGHNSTQTNVGGYNGGGYSGNNPGVNSMGGGGATDIRLVPGEWDRFSGLASRIIVAAGGGGAVSIDYKAGAGGALVGEIGYGNPSWTRPGGGSQLTGGDGYIYYQDGFFGFGPQSNTGGWGGGGGGGFFGGANGHGYTGAGGSSYISGYLGCVAYHINYDVAHINKYKEKDKYKGTFNINLIDSHHEIPTKDFYVRIYYRGVLTDTIKHDLNNFEVTDLNVFGEFIKNKNYTVKLSVKVRDRFYNISSVSFDTTSEIRSITTEDQLANVHSNGRYIVLNDLNFYKRGCFWYTFYGEIDFQGHAINTNVQNRSGYLFHTLGAGSLIKNLVMNYDIDNTSSRSWYYGLTVYNYGTIDNYIININEGATQHGNYVMPLCCDVNYGTIRNFIINAKDSYSANGSTGMLAWVNDGLLENGYLYGKNVNGNFPITSGRKDVAALVGHVYNKSVIRNIYSLVSVDKDNTNDLENSVGNLIGYSRGRVENVYSVEGPNNLFSKHINEDPNFGTIEKIIGKNVFYVADKTYTAKVSSKISKLALYDKEFQRQVLGSGFNVNDYVPYGYYPQLKLNDCMPRQDMIELPKVDEKDLVDVTSSEQITVDGNTAEIMIYLNNPAGETISSVGIRDIGKVEILEQKNEYGKTSLRVKLSEPIKYQSKYFIRQLKVTGVLGYEYEKNYTDFERPIDVALYYPINSLEDWKYMKDMPTQNYILTTDLDFKDVVISQYVITKNFTGSLNGNGHTLKNITVGSTSYYGFFHCYVSGTIENLFIENYKKTGFNSFGGFFYRARDGAKFDNIHIKNAEINANTYLGGLLSYSDNTTTIRNCSVTNLKARCDEDASITNFRAGGLVSRMYTGIVSNSFVQNMDLRFENLLSSKGVGGIVGEFNDGFIEDVYTTGSIFSNSNYVGGIVGSGNGQVKRVWTYVDIMSELDFVGGVYGYRTAEIIENTLVGGSVYSSYTGQNINRTLGNTLNVSHNYFAWNKQKLNGLIIANSNTETFVTTEQLSDSEIYTDVIGLGDSFDYSNIKGAILPKLKNFYTDELLPNQQDYVFKSEPVKVDSIIIDAKVDTAELNIIFDNPNNLNITNVNFDFLSIKKVMSSATKDGKTYFRVIVTPDYYIDSYMITNVEYVEQNVIKKINLNARIEKTFYRQVKNVDDWLAISKRNKAENYLITADLDFSPEANNGRVINVPYNIMIGRLESDIKGEIRTISNISVSPKYSNSGFIKVLTKTVENIKFENITVDVSRSGNYVGLVAFNYSDIKNLHLHNIKINAPNCSYVAPIAYNAGYDTRNVVITGDTNADNQEHLYSIRGVSYVGGFVGYWEDRDSVDIKVDGIKVHGTGQYTGGVVGYKIYRYTSNDFFYQVSNVEVIGKTDTGGVFGYGVSNGMSSKKEECSYITDSKIHSTGGSYVGAFSGRAGHYTTKYVIVNNCDVTSDGTYGTGGLFGWSYDVQDIFVNNVRVTNKGTYTGGVTGSKGYTYQRIKVKDVTVTSTGEGTGGFFGNMDGNLWYSTADNLKVFGRTRVGGVAGRVSRARTIANVFNVSVNASSIYSGLIYGYISDMDPDGEGLSSYAKDTIFVNSSITSSSDYVGLLGGYVPRAIYPNYYEKIIISCEMNVREKARYGIMTGYDSDLNQEPLEGIFIYENSKLNFIDETYQVVSSKYIKEVDNKPTLNLSPEELINMFPNSATLKSEDFYRKRVGFTGTYWLFSWTSKETPMKVADGYFPKNKQFYTYGTDFKVPEGDLTFNLRANAMGIPHELPNVKVYSSGVSTLNIEFDEVDHYSYFKVYENDKLVFKQDLNKLVYSINYNYKSDITIVLCDGVNTYNKVFKASDLVNLVSVYDSKYVYIYNGKLKGNIKDIDGKFIHLFGKYALRDDLAIYDFVNSKFTSLNNLLNVMLLDGSIPLYKFNYNGTHIDTYGTHSIIKKDGKDIIYNNQLFVKDGNIEIVDSNFDNKKNSIIVDNYAKDNYVTVLGDDGVIYNLKTPIKLPVTFTNSNIKYMSNNINTNNSIVVVMYDSGKVVIFDYRTGKTKKIEKATKKVSVVKYFKDNLKKKHYLVDKSITNDYNETLLVKKKLEKLPLLETVDGEFINKEINKELNKDIVKTKYKNNYVTYYNSTKNNYDVVNIGRVFNDNKDIKIDNNEDDKILGDNSLVSFYMNKSLLENVISSVSFIYIFGFILFGILVALVLWLKNNSYFKES